MRYRLGLDVGTSSLGWAVLELDNTDRPSPIRLVDLGVRIYSDGRNPKDKTSLATQRRVARGMRRQRDRRLKRRARLMDDLLELGLMPIDVSERKSLEKLDPYELRAKAVEGPVSKHELGRALFHLDQRRGFKSNRKTDAAAGDDTGVIRSGVAELDRRMAQSPAKTLGAYLHNRMKREKGTRARPDVGIYPERRHYQQEFECIRETQAPHQSLSNSDWERLEQTIFFQRPLRPVLPGRCQFETNEYRAPKALPSTQRFRILQEAGNLRIIPDVGNERSFPQAALDEVIERLGNQKTLGFNAIAKLGGVEGGERLNFDDGKRKHLQGDETAAALIKAGWLKESWSALSLEERDRIVELLIEVEDEAQIVERLTTDWGLDPETALAVSRARLPEGYSSLSRKAIGRLLPLMDQGVPYYAAAKEVYGHHSNFEDGEILKKLPYYGERLTTSVVGGGDPSSETDEGRYGRFPNPTVHIGLNQIRRLINALIDQYGHPQEIVVELGREMKQTLEQKKETLSRQKADQDRNEKYRAQIEEMGATATPDLMRRLRLWEEQGPPQARVCPYSGDPLSFEQVVHGDGLDVDHILPFSKTLDDSMSNKVLVKRVMNRRKGDRAPETAFQGDEYEAIQLRTAKWPANKSWRFRVGAMERFNKKSDFLDRQLNETRHLARATKTYLNAICPNKDTWVLTGKMTALLRARWGLNSLLGSSNQKDRTDHRHHAIDAVVQAMTDRGLLQQIARASARDDVDRVIDAVPENPITLPDLRDQVRDKLNNLTVYHKPNHWRPNRNGATTGALHNDTAYGLVGEPDTKNKQLVRYRKPLASLSPEKLQETIADRALAARIADDWEKAKATGMKWEAYTAALEKPDKERGGGLPKTGIKSVRIIEGMSANSLFSISDASGRRYKAYKTDGNAFMDIYEDAKGLWRGETVRRIDANQNGFVPAWRSLPGVRFVMRLHVDDLVAIEEGGPKNTFRVVKMSGQAIYFAAHNEGGALKTRDADKDDPFKYLQKSAGAAKAIKMRRLKIDDLGHVFDPQLPT